MTIGTIHRSRWQKADDNFRGQIKLLMLKMGVKNLTMVASEAGITAGTLYNRFKHPATLLKREERQLASLFERYGMTYDPTLGEGVSV